MDGDRRARFWWQGWRWLAIDVLWLIAWELMLALMAGAHA